MAVGKGSMERASKAAGKAAPKEATETAEVKAQSEAPAAKKTTKTAKPKKAVTKNVIAATSPQVMDEIIYQHSSQMLDRDAAPNENFGVGDAMPVYYF